MWTRYDGRGGVGGVSVMSGVGWVECTRVWVFFLGMRSKRRAQLAPLYLVFIHTTPYIAHFEAFV